MNVFGVIVFVSLVISPIFAQKNETFTGTCPAIGTKIIDESKYVGKWYEIKKFENTLITGDCGLPDYVKTDKGFNVSYVTTNLSDKKNSTSALELRRRAIPNTAGTYDVYIDGKNDTMGQRVLDTDYVTYSIVWDCIYNDTDKKNTQRLSIYSRNNTLNDTMTETVMKFLKSNGINNATLKTVEQDNKKCGRNSATALVLPTLFSMIIATLLAKKF